MNIDPDAAKYLIKSKIFVDVVLEKLECCRSNIRPD